MYALSPLPLRHEKFSVPYLVDETLREGIERTAFPISLDAKMQILHSLTDAGIRDFVIGCGPEEPLVWDRVQQEKRDGTLPSDTQTTFIILVNCWETAYYYFSQRKQNIEDIEDTIFSFGMITYRKNENEFEKALMAFKKLGAKKFKASILNNFRTSVSDQTYSAICQQIDWAISLGVSIIRINDSLGSLQPHITQWLCSKLVKDYPGITFCLHAHNDNGLAVANAMQSIQSGFQMIEGSLAGFGNRSGIAPIEQVLKLCLNNDIKLGNHEINLKKIIRTAQACEEIFLQPPNIYRSVSGIFETDSNYGVLNIPDFLEAKDEKSYFINLVGLHPNTIKQALKEYCPSLDLTNIPSQRWLHVIELIKIKMQAEAIETEAKYKALRLHLHNYYRSSAYSPQKIASIAYKLLVENEA
ncbi:pyruvate carboxyltransferase [Chromobacterium haemolyticum]|uniref:2-isopropylmalate synthase n=1 Tax=Chromobacterium fluminis TaxID=3044269 RepID=A0ABX0LFK0_9NEIS|nr:pyruvate carboxyltransferase [Chromobacterium haemolyticum]NHR06107.1 pyruvate carboxyltransferase [Chromobacterium haemolyticum]OQS35110.1 pyruvate carboxyltransferase [Chromobacterium haemolyticum]